MKINNVLLAGLVSIGLLTIGGNSAFAGTHFFAGNPGGLRGGSSYRVLPTPANQAFERNNAWNKYRAQNSQIQAPSASTGTSGSVLQPKAGTP